MIKLIIDSTERWDTLTFQRIFGWNGKRTLDKVMLFITHSADGYYYPIILIMVWAFDTASLIPLGLSAAAAFAVELPLYLTMKKMVKRNRPFVQLPGIHFLIQPPDEFSFPSGHTTAAFLLAVISSSCYPSLTVLFITWALFVGVSRVYLGVHYPSDVLVGMVLGVFTGLFGLAIL